MIAAMVGAILVIVLALIAMWLLSPAFRTWSEQPKYSMLQRNSLFECAGTENRLPVANIEQLDGLNEMKNEGERDETRC